MTETFKVVLRLKAKKLTEFLELFGGIRKGCLAVADSSFLIWHAKMKEVSCDYHMQHSLTFGRLHTPVKSIYCDGGAV